MAQIVPNQTFLDGRDRFEAGNTYEVDDELASYFAQCGWIEGREDEMTDPVQLVGRRDELEVQSAKHSGGEVNG